MVGATQRSDYAITAPRPCATLIIPISMSNPGITTAHSVDAAMTTGPAAAAVLNAFGIDTCCGGRATIAEAAAHAHVDPATVIDAIATASRDAEHKPASALPQAKVCCGGCK